jgi:pimeloyl-ACP methyl ester carboxylesterase
MIEQNFIHFKNSKLHYIKAGGGKDVLLFFHGFGQDHSVYIPIVQSLADQYTVYIIDLYFHGKSVWGYGEEPLEKAHWKKTIDLFLKTNEIDNFSLVGFSLGGKFALATLEAFPEKTKNIFLIAPDGIKTSFWYSLATYPLVFRKFFKSLINTPQRFTQIANMLNKLSLVDKGLIRFADFQMNSEEKRKRVYYSWVVFRRLTFNLKNVSKLIKQHNIRPTIIVGKYDKVITPDNIRKFARQLSGCRFEVVEAGHTGLLTRQILETSLHG